MKFILKFYYLLFKLVAGTFYNKILKICVGYKFFSTVSFAFKKIQRYDSSLPNRKRILGIYFPDGPK